MSRCLVFLAVCVIDEVDARGCLCVEDWNGGAVGPARCALWAGEGDEMMFI